MRNAILKDKAEKDRQRFIDSLDTEAICRLASSYHGGIPCTTFASPKHGSFNVCIFVEFETNPPERWAVRMPLPARAAWIDERIETELATMRYVAANTTIPVPRVHAYSFTEGSPIQTAFIMMDYIQGQTLKDLGFKKGKRWRSYTSPTEATTKLHEQLADFYVQLRQLEFPEIGALGLPVVDGKPSYDCDPDDIRVCHRPISIEIIMQELEGMNPGARIKPRATFSTARSFVDALFWLSENEFDKSPDPGFDTRGQRNTLYARHHFPRFVLDSWLDSTADKGPFVLMHGDILMLMSNLLFDDDLNLVGALDWEWSFVVPAQMLVPPVWLTGGGPEWMLIGTNLFYNEVGRLVAAVKDRERALQVPPRLSQEWAKLEAWCHTAVVVALLSPDLTYDVYWDFVFYEAEEPRPRDPGFDFRAFYMRAIHPRLTAFMEHPERKALLARKEEEQIRFFEDEKEYFNNPAARQIAGEGL
ncbi:kinase-like domain-containing protein [Dactylonectria macrodidyma]|uniref:Kinase-like domain-containing protein n=1 Tax=Dactylonectria macrodidyma TaxID=307937 RepID=A0A9P9DFH7_9HYPO|nr:kinase-like domain-containing protein [Dactylonectria macrodidyma]